MNIERLQHLITILQNVKPETFDLSTWHCGTVACAVGHACLDPVFLRQGLSLTAVRGSHSLKRPNYGPMAGWEAVELFFGLDQCQAAHLFSISKYDSCSVTTQDVIKRIESLIKEPQ